MTRTIADETCTADSARPECCNAGQASRDHTSIPLIPLGLEQAWMTAGSFSVAPNLIVASPCARAQATAQATAATFPGTAVETWAIQEFT
jgi:broad specificity phosphatase PhoE